MGLDVIVYKNYRNLLKVCGNSMFIVDELTGECASRDEDQSKASNSNIVACEQRLGNIDKIAYLRKLVEEKLRRDNSLLVDRVLYSATHSGDIIRVESELRSIKGGDGTVIDEFVIAMELLVKAGERENNPLVFV